ncbi:hypothetical protein Tco_1416613, partial [Tanacetum coccineum]
EASPKMKRKLKKPASPMNKRTFVTEEEEEPEPAKRYVTSKKPTTKRQSVGGSSEGADSESKVHDEQTGMSKDTSEGTGSKLGVLDVSTVDSSKSENESWGDSGDEANEQSDDKDEQSDDDHEQADDERTESNDKEEEKQDDEYVHTPKHYVPTDEETNDESKEFDEEECEELYGDVNISLKDAKTVGKEKGDVEMTNTETCDAELENVNHEGAGNQVKDDAQATQKTEGPILSSSISSDYSIKYLNFDNIPLVYTEVVSMLDINIQHEVPRTSPLLTIPVSVVPEHTVVNLSKIVTTASSKTISYLLSSLFPYLQQLTPVLTPKTIEATTSTTAVSESKTLTAFHQRITNLEKVVKELKTIDHSSALLSTIKSEVPKVVKEYLGTSLDDSLQKDEDDMDEGVADKLKKRKQDDANKDEGPSTGSDQGLKRQKTSKDVEPSKKAKSTEASKGIPTFNLLKGTCKSCVELEYNFEECYKVVTDRLDWNNPEGKEYPFDLSKPLPLIMNQGRQVVPVDFFINNDLEYLKGGILTKKCTTSTTKTKAAKYEIPGIKVMVPSLWSPVKVAYDRYVVWRVSH